jgi:heterodisulfide reductase subunit B2
VSEYLYYPGCSQRATARGYDESLLAIAPRLGLSLQELPDWSCCGTGMALSVNKTLSLTLAARNLAIAKPMGTTVVTPCPSCALTLGKAAHVLEDGGPMAENVRTCLDAGGMKYAGGVKVRHLMEVIVNDVGVDKLKAETKVPLTNKRIAPYYGCQVVRPVAEGDDADDPQNLEAIITAIGGLAADFPLKTACCGGALAVTRPDVGEQMCLDLLKSIKAAKADIIVTPCPLCQVTLEMAQRQHKALLGDEAMVPVMNLTQLIGVAFGLSERALGLTRALMPSACKRALARTEAQAVG